MTKDKINRINELARKSRTTALSKEELEEQKKLRDEYRKSVIGNLTGQLDNTSILMPDGKKVPVKDMKKD